ncbi:MAG TPA: DUF5681 domain-containing protein [Blastocatellia bacterium]|nr:DUF5681 domain-containing protein [Blastocatellia bacterium]
MTAIRDKGERHPNSLANLELGRFRPGQSGNPNGWPKGVPRVSTALAQLLRCAATEKYQVMNKADLVARALFNKAVRGDVEAIKEVMNRTEGKVKDVVEIVDEGARADLAIHLFILKTGLPRDEAARWIEQAATAALTEGNG